ncbi:LemA family protein [Budviciaceae bacterium CWB-B4]|uniref:LemA family protein n=1 Tax=Limnobaculum xujianqingii TaxID=2738837 RepID=A0A9D7FPY8_9GAMM|nr:LemA family protein [Limnobaculum xujianqingii]MBK5071429.1 LemA family protein [Limnobaculum xujianqingii]MBK5174738.1 LemA family protein [Limnobaculum xujianqingii]
MSFSSHFRWLAMSLLALMLTGCNYNEIQTQDENVTASWSEVLNQYQRRADLIPNLVSTAKGYAAHEADVFKQVSDARSRIGSTEQNMAAPDSEEAMRAFQQSQAQLGSALSRLLVIRESYPDLKANEMFTNLMTQLEGTENRIAVARQRYIKAVQDYNLEIRRFPGLITAKLLGYKTKQNFLPENSEQISTAPSVDFSPSGSDRR